jgi:hypothetical protein
VAGIHALKKLLGQDDTQADREVEDGENYFASQDQRHTI